MTKEIREFVAWQKRATPEEISGRRRTMMLLLNGRPDEIRAHVRRQTETQKESFKHPESDLFSL
jgi:hypothetical protein